MAPGDLARMAAWTASSLLAARHLAGTWQLARTLAWLREENEHCDHRSERSPQDVHVIVPVLHEQAHIAAALTWWEPHLAAFPGMSLTFVTTAREERERESLAVKISASDRLSRTDFPQLPAEIVTELDRARPGEGKRLPAEAARRILSETPLTRQVVDALLAARDHPQVRHVTYLGAGRKAAQINYATQGLPDRGYVAIYDIDSRPDRAALTAIHSVLNAGRPPIVQQHALHCPPPSASEGGPGGSWLQRRLVSGTALLQTVWTVRREIPYARRHQRFTSRSGAVAGLRAGLSQPVGHGLFLRHNVLADLGGLPETTVLDDVPTGVPLALLRIPTVSVPHLTEVPAAHTVAEAIAQGRRWFCSYLDYPPMLRAAGHDGQGMPARRRLIGAIALYRGASWLAASPVTALTIGATLAPRSGRGLRTTAITGLVLAVVAPVVMTATVRGRPLHPTVVARDSADLLLAYLTRSIGPWLAVADALRGQHPAVADTPSPKTHHRGDTP